MVFLKHSTTALLALILVSFASISITSKANAQEVKSPDLGKACPMTQYLVMSQSNCKTASKKSSITTTTEQILLPVTPQPLATPKTPDKTLDTPTTPSVSPIQTLATPTATLSADLLFSLVNSHRKEIDLPPFEHDANVCSVADSRKDEMAQEIFVTHQLHAGFYAKNLPYFATENLIWQHTEAQALSWWLHSPIHRAAIEGHYKYACGVCNGEVCDMVFTNYEKKIASAGFIQGASTPKNLVQ